MQIEDRRAVGNVAGKRFPLARFHVIASSLFSVILSLFRHPERSEGSRVLQHAFAAHRSGCGGEKSLSRTFSAFSPCQSCALLTPDAKRPSRFFATAAFAQND